MTGRTALGGWGLALLAVTLLGVLAFSLAWLPALLLGLAGVLAIAVALADGLGPVGPAPAVDVRASGCAVAVAVGAVAALVGVVAFGAALAALGGAVAILGLLGMLTGSRGAP